MKILIISMIIILSYSFSFANEVVVKWDRVNGAIGYRIYRSDDLGSTWVMHKEVIGQLYNMSTLSDVPSTGLILFRVSSYDSNQEIIRVWSGSWYNGELEILTSPGGVQIR